MTLKLYQNEFDELYSRPTVTKGIRKGPFPGNQESLQDSLYRVITATMSLKDCPYAANFLDLGLDSLYIMALSRNINAFLTALHPELRPITINTIYAHPSIQHLKTVLKSSKTSKPDTFSSESRPQRMQRLFEKYSAHSPPLKESATKPHKNCL